jgi:glycosyltransferase involved in cell wall biosynthesis
MRIAWFTPFNRRSAIGHYSAIVCTELRKAHEPVIFASDLDSMNEAWPTDLPVVCLKGVNTDHVLHQLGEFPLLVYNMGDHGPYHRLVFEFLKRRPGIMVLHDLVLRDFFASYYLSEEPDVNGLLQLMETCHGRAGRVWMENLLAGLVPDLSSDPNITQYHMAEGAERCAHGVVVHSEFARQRVAGFAGSPVAKIDFPTPSLAQTVSTWPPPRADGGRARVLTFGMVNPNKMIDAVIEAIASSRYLREHMTYKVLGDSSDPKYLERLKTMIGQHDLGGVVQLLGPQPDDRLHEELRAADVVVNLRNPHLGESSWSLLESLFAGKPTVVWNHGYYAEFPEGVVRKVSSRDELVCLLENLCRDPGLRQRCGQQARRYATEHFDTGRYCEKLLAFADSVMRNRIVLDVADNLADLVHEVALGAPAQALLDRVARELGYLLDDAA